MINPTAPHLHLSHIGTRPNFYCSLTPEQSYDHIWNSPQIDSGLTITIKLDDTSRSSSNLGIPPILVDCHWTDSTAPATSFYCIRSQWFLYTIILPHFSAFIDYSSNNFMNANTIMWQKQRKKFKLQHSPCDALQETEQFHEHPKIWDSKWNPEKSCIWQTLWTPTIPSPPRYILLLSHHPPTSNQASTQFNKAHIIMKKRQTQ